jgi:hypothetical protein
MVCCSVNTSEAPTFIDQQHSSSSKKCLLLRPADSVMRQVQHDHEAAEKKLAELKAEKERVTRQVGVAQLNPFEAAACFITGQLLSYCVHANC